MVREDEALLHGSPFKQLIDQTLISTKRRELTVSLLMLHSLKPMRSPIKATLNDTMSTDEQPQ